MGENVVDAEWRRYVDGIEVVLVDAGVGLAVTSTPDPIPPEPSTGEVTYGLAYHKGSDRDVCPVTIAPAAQAHIKNAPTQAAHNARCVAAFGAWYANRKAPFKTQSRRGVQAF